MTITDHYSSSPTVTSTVRGSNGYTMRQAICSDYGPVQIAPSAFVFSSTHPGLATFGMASGMGAAFLGDLVENGPNRTR